MSVCRICDRELPLEQFYSNGKGGKRTDCRECSGKSNKARKHTDEWRAKERVYQKQRRAEYPDQFRGFKLQSNFNITLEDYNKLLSEQNGVCAICSQECPSGNSLAVDHDRRCCAGKTSCGKCIRGLLCTKCNPALGFLNDDPDRAIAAATYLLLRQDLNAFKSLNAQG